MKKKRIIPYQPHLVEKARQLRNNTTYSEKLLWKYLRNKQLYGYDFDRQKPIDKYIVDFFCNELMLVIEIGGITHENKLEEDNIRQESLERLGLSILRFNALDVVNNTVGVIEVIEQWIQKNKTPTPFPSQEGSQIMQSQKHIFIRFYEELNDFLPKELRKRDIDYKFTGNPSIKDVIEAIGVPHPEVDLILVNGKSVNFQYNIQSGDHISVYPVFELIDISPINHLRPEPLRTPKFILDINLGKLAVKLRMLGFNSRYQNTFKDKEIVNIASAENRIILTRDQGLLKNNKVTRGYWVRNTIPKRQIVEIIDKFDLYSKIKSFTICTVCNGRIEQVEKNDIIDLIPEKVKMYFNEFYHCINCAKIYWKGSHYIKMQKEIESLKNKSK